MEAARRSRLRLSRRRPPLGAGSPSPRPESPPDGDGDGECARLWAELLRTVSAGLSPDGEWPPLPAPPGQVQGTRGSAERAAPPEGFAVGPETFAWAPFPPAPGRASRALRRAGPRPASPPPEPLGGPRPRGPPAEGGAQALRSCPMCQAGFRPGLAQVDIDSHLAQCLEDSTEDVSWTYNMKM